MPSTQSLAASESSAEAAVSLSGDSSYSIGAADPCAIAQQTCGKRKNPEPLASGGGSSVDPMHLDLEVDGNPPEYKTEDDV